MSDKKPAKIKCQIADRKIKSIKAEILCGDIHDKNDFENGDNVKIEEFTDFRQLKDGFTATLPACSVVKCKRCLLLEAGEKASYKTVSDYIDNLDDSLKVDEKQYKLRLEKCKNCDYLISGMCLKCGCYVEIRALLKDKHCACYDNRLW